MIGTATTKEHEMNLSAVFRLAALALVLISPVAGASDADDLEALVNDFLANVDDAAMHDRFWAEDLIYSSSSGSRFGKAEIMQGFDSASEDEADAEPEETYEAVNVQVNVYGDTAVVAFKLIATPTDGSAASEYHNTGTFVRRDGRWQVVAWQATKIPPAE
jgi:hypothetical protein